MFKTYLVKIDTPDKVIKFVNEVSVFDVDTALKSQDGRYAVSASSLLGIMSLDLSQPHILSINVPDNEAGEKTVKLFESMTEKYLAE